MSQLRLMTRRLLKSLVYHPAASKVIRMSLRPIARVLPRRLLLRIPVVGILKIRLWDSAELRLYVNGLDDISLPVFWYGIDTYEPEVMDLFRLLLKRATVILDIGANIGIYGLIAAQENPACRVYAFEPVPQTFEVLEKNVRINSLDNCDTVWCAVSNFNGAVDLYLPHSGIPLSASTRPGFRPASKIISVPAVTIDQFVDDNRVEKIDLMKIDTETTEYQVLEGASSMIARDQPVIICEVLSGSMEDHLRHFLETMCSVNYNYFMITSAGLIAKECVEGDPYGRSNNYLFVPTSRVQDTLSDSQTVFRDKDVEMLGGATE